MEIQVFGRTWAKYTGKRSCLCPEPDLELSERLQEREMDKDRTGHLHQTVPSLFCKTLILNKASYIPDNHAPLSKRAIGLWKNNVKINHTYSPATQL